VQTLPATEDNPLHEYCTIIGNDIDSYATAAFKHSYNVKHTCLCGDYIAMVVSDGDYDSAVSVVIISITAKGVVAELTSKYLTMMSNLLSSTFSGNAGVYALCLANSHGTNRVICWNIPKAIAQYSEKHKENTSTVFTFGDGIKINAVTFYPHSNSKFIVGCSNGLLYTCNTESQQDGDCMDIEAQAAITNIEVCKVRDGQYYFIVTSNDRYIYLIDTDSMETIHSQQEDPACSIREIVTTPGYFTLLQPSIEQGNTTVKVYAILNNSSKPLPIAAATLHGTSYSDMTLSDGVLRVLTYSNRRTIRRTVNIVCPHTFVWNSNSHNYPLFSRYNETMRSINLLTHHAPILPPEVWYHILSIAVSTISHDATLSPRGAKRKEQHHHDDDE